MNKHKKITIVIIAALVIMLATFFITKPKKITHTYEPATDIGEIKNCIKSITGSETLTLEITQNQQLFTDVYRFCLKTVDDIEETLKALTGE